MVKTFGNKLDRNKLTAKSPRWKEFNLLWKVASSKVERGEKYEGGGHSIKKVKKCAIDLYLWNTNKESWYRNACWFGLIVWQWEVGLQSTESCGDLEAAMISHRTPVPLYHCYSVPATVCQYLPCFTLTNVEPRKRKNAHRAAFDCYKWVLFC